MDEKLKFVARLIEGETMAGLCREFGISRKTGYKIWDRYKESGIEGLPAQSRRPYKQANQLPFQIEKLIVQIKKEKPNWGARKIRERLRRKYPSIKLPANSTVHAVLDRHGLVMAQKRRRYRAEGTPLSYTNSPNVLWCADYKGEFLMGIRDYNHERPHEALEMKTPSEVYKASTRTYDGIPEVEYPMHDRTIKVTTCGRICMDRRKINFSKVFAGQPVGVRQVDEALLS